MTALELGKHERYADKHPIAQPVRVTAYPAISRTASVVLALYDAIGGCLGESRISFSTAPCHSSLPNSSGIFAITGKSFL